MLVGPEWPGKAVKMKIATKSPARKPTPSRAFKAGIATRGKVLGTEYVKRAFKNADEFTLPFQEIATEIAWGSVWNRKGLVTARPRRGYTGAMHRTRSPQ
jgi:hypothetical protein